MCVCVCVCVQSDDAEDADRMYDLTAVVVHCGRSVLCGCGLYDIIMTSYYPQWAEPRPLHHHSEELWLLAPV